MAVPVTSTIQNQIANLYIAILGRNPEPVGFGYWCETLANNNGTQAALNAITVGFGNSPEFTATYGGQTTTAAITLMYNNVLNRAPDANGLSYWTTQYNTYLAQSGDVSAALSLTGNAIITAAAANTGTADQTNIQAKQATAISSGTAAPSTTVALTTSIDTLTIGNNTTVVGVVAGVTNPLTATLNAGDSITGTGSGNTLRIIDTTTAALADGLAGVTMSGVQTVTVQKTDSTAASTYSFAAISGVTTVQNTNSSGAAATTVNFTGLTAGTVVSVSGANAAAGTTTAAYTVGNSPVLVNLNGGLTTVQTITANTGTNTAATITSTGGVNGVATTGAAANAILSLSGAGLLNSLTVNAATNMRATLTGANFAATGADLVVSGAATNVNLGTAGIYKTINASGLTAGGVTVNASTTLTAFTGGAGNDTLTGNLLGAGSSNTAVIAANAVIDAGAGRDVLGATLVNAGNAAAFKNFEVLGLQNGYSISATTVVTAGAAVVLDASLLTNSTISGVSIGGATTGSSITNLVATATPFTIAVNTTSAAGATVNLGFTAASVTGNTDTVAYSFAGTSTTANNLIANAGFVTHQGIELVTIASNGIAGMTNQLRITDDALQTVTITGTRGMNLTTDAQALIGTATATALTTINASGMTPAATHGLTFAETNTLNPAAVMTGLTITGSSGDDAITVLTQSAAGHAATATFGADTVILTSGGIDNVIVTNAISQLGTANTVTAFANTTITGAGVGDSITFGAGAMAVGTAATNVAAATTLLGAVNIAVSAAANTATWFQFAGSTYVVDNFIASDGFTADDVVVALTGTVDLSNSAMVAGVLTIA